MAISGNTNNIKFHALCYFNVLFSSNDFFQVFTMTYCIASEALMYPFNEGALGDTIFNAVKRAYLNVFGDINMDGIESNIIEGLLL